MKHNITLITALLLAPLAALHAADAPSLQPPQHLGPPLPEHAVTNRAFAGIPSMAVAPKGRMWATWYAGPTPAEDLNNYVVLSTSSDDGATWNELLTVDPDAGGPVRSFDPELWVSPDGRLFFFWRRWRKVAAMPNLECGASRPPNLMPRSQRGHSRAALAMA